MNPVLILCSPWDVTQEERTEVRVGDGPSPNTYGVAGQFWSAAIIERPKLAIELMDQELSGAVQAGTVDISLGLSKLRGVAGKKLHWRGAPIKIWSAPDYNFSTAGLEFDGRIVSARIDKASKLLRIRAEVSTQFIEKPLLTFEYSGAGGLNGDAALRGTLRPAGFGLNENIPPVWFDLTDNIGQIDGYGNCIAITRLMEGASDMGPRVADYATYALLKAAIVAGTVPAGRWASSVFDGCVGLGAPPKGVIGVNAQFGAGKSGAFARRILEVNGGVPIGNIDTAAFDALDAALDYPTHWWTKSQRQIDDLLAAIAGGVNSTPIVTFQGLVTITRAVTSASVATLDRSGSVEPRVINWVTAELDPPFYQMKARVARPANVLSDDEVFYEDDIIDRGVYDPAITYYQGNLVWDEFGAQYLYTNGTPAAAQPLPVPPATSTSHWTLKRAAPIPTYDDGIDINTLRPNEPGADVTNDNTAAAIEGQGDLATENEVTTATIAPNSVSVPYSEVQANITVTGTATTIFESAAWLTTGDTLGGGGVVFFNCFQDSGATVDRFIRYSLLIDIDDGAGYIQYDSGDVGAYVAGGANVQTKLCAFLSKSFTARRIKVKVTGQSLDYIAGTPSGTWAVTYPKITVFAGKR